MQVTLRAVVEATLQGCLELPAHGLTVFAVIGAGAVDAVHRQIVAATLRASNVGSGRRGSRVNRMPW